MRHRLARLVGPRSAGLAPRSGQEQRHVIHHILLHPLQVVGHNGEVRVFLLQLLDQRGSRQRGHFALQFLHLVAHLAGHPGHRAQHVLQSFRQPADVIVELLPFLFRELLELLRAHGLAFPNRYEGNAGRRLDDTDILLARLLLDLAEGGFLGFSEFLGNRLTLRLEVLALEGSRNAGLRIGDDPCQVCGELLRKARG